MRAMRIDQKHRTNRHFFRPTLALKTKLTNQSLHTDDKAPAKRDTKRKPQASSMRRIARLIKSLMLEL